MSLNIESPVFIHRHLFQGAGIPVCSKLASQRAVVDGSAIQLELTIGTIQSTDAADRRIPQGDGLPTRDDGACVLNCVAVEHQVASLCRDGALVGKVGINISD